MTNPKTKLEELIENVYKFELMRLKPPVFRIKPKGKPSKDFKRIKAIIDMIEQRAKL